MEGLGEWGSPLASLRSDHSLVGVTPTLMSSLQLLLAPPHASTAALVTPQTGEWRPGVAAASCSLRLGEWEPILAGEDVVGR